jgi:ribonuclease HII
MRRAVNVLPTRPDYVLIDGNKTISGPWRSKAIVKGDSLVRTIGAASIIAKVTRDRLMIESAQHFPQYGFDKHFGYPTAAHRAAIKKFGPCPIHRRAFRGVREFLLEDSQVHSS